MTTMTAETGSLDAVIFAVTGGKFRVRLTEPEAGPGKRFGYVLDDTGNIIGDASDYVYGGRGFAIHTGPYGGFASFDQIEFVP